MNKINRIIISGGGTGGHIFPALSIAKAVQRRYPECEVLFVGAQDRMEMEKVPAAGYSIIGLPVMGLQRSLTLKNLMFLPKLIISLIKCRGIVKSFKPDVVVGVGGFASGPLLRAAQKMGIPTLIQEQNSYAGITNKLLGRKAGKICVAYGNMGRYFPKNKLVLTGNPVRKDLINVQSNIDEAMEYFKLKPTKKTLLIVGGSLGARTINESVLQNLDELIRKDIQVIWQTGTYFYTKAQQGLGEFKDHSVLATKFINRMDLAYSAADFIISRAGAGTISELSIVGKPVILVPSPNVAEDHQTKNANALVERNAALMVKDVDAREKLMGNLLQLMDNEEQQIELATQIKKMAMPDADELIVNEIEKLT